MEVESYVPDANVFLEYIFDRPLAGKSRQLLEDAIVGDTQILVPSLLLDELTEVLCGNLDNLKEVRRHLEYIEALAKQDVLHFVVPDTEVRMKAIEIARTGNPKSGYPELSDSLYHALAIVNGAVFITNDTKHVAKVEKFGHIRGLAEYGSESIAG